MGNSYQYYFSEHCLFNGNSYGILKCVKYCILTARSPVLAIILLKDTVISSDTFTWDDDNLSI